MKHINNKALQDYLAAKNTYLNENGWTPVIDTSGSITEVYWLDPDHEFKLCNRYTTNKACEAQEVRDAQLSGDDK